VVLVTQKIGKRVSSWLEEGRCMMEDVICAKGIPLGEGWRVERLEGWKVLVCLTYGTFQVFDLGV